ncbi:hypothetical protein G6F35_003104 [Rhizopus arrhizus]|nr:hypothetical protein G6F35_003104 [Rhizopus arrhizus]
MTCQSNWWHEQVLSPTNECFYKDFVLISEFSEIEGPLPLVIISGDEYIDLKQHSSEQELKRLGLNSFDFNAFVLRVVSVDRTDQSIEPCHSPIAFSIPDDSQVYFTDNEHQFSAFTHHLTLFDIHARGYVHPVSLSYITRDFNKMLIKSDDLRERFHQASSHLKRGNYVNFMLDLKCHLLDLEYTKSTTKHLSMEAIEQAATVTRFILETLEFSLPPIEPPRDYQPTCIDTLYPVPNFERKLRSLAQLCQQSTRVIPLVYSMIEPQTNVPTRRLTFSNSIMNDIYHEVIQCLKQMTVYLGQSSVVLDLEEEEESFVEPVSFALTMGHTFMLNMVNPQPREQVSKELKEISEDTQPTELYPILFTASKLWKSEEIGLLGVLGRYRSLIVDVIFSLMTGRAVLVQGSLKNKDLIKQVVKALSVFVPGQSITRHQVIEWFEKGKLRDIQNIKLVGIDKGQLDSSIHIDSSCVLDVDTGSLNSSPVYVEGQWINQFLDRMSLFSSDASYLAYLHTVFMTISLKAFIYHHLYVTDDFKLENNTSSFHKGYTSDNNSEASSTVSSTSTLSRKWSQRLLNYLKKHEEEQESDDDYSDENQATITPKRVEEKQQQQPRSLVGLFDNHLQDNSSNSRAEEDDDNRIRKSNSISTLYSINSRKSSISSVLSSQSSDSLEDALNRALTINNRDFETLDESDDNSISGYKQHRRQNREW